MMLQGVVQMNIFDIIGPIMIGPSSSHTAGAVRLGNIVRNILGENPTEARITLYNSFAKTGTGHGTDKALVAGILGFSTDDDRIKNSFDKAKEQGVNIELIFGETDLDYHPNTAEFFVKGNNSSTTVIGSSIGGGRVIVFSIDGFKTEFSGEYNTIITIHRDRPGIIAKVASLLAERNVNIAQMRVSRESKAKQALMIIEMDEEIPEGLVLSLKNLEHIYRVVAIKSVLR